MKRHVLAALNKNKPIFAGMKRIFAGFLFFVLCMAVYLGISALLSHFLYTTNSSVFHEEHREAKTENGQNLLAHKSSYKAADINFSAYIADRDPYWELEKSICRNYQYDKELLAHIGKIHEAVDGFLKKEIPAQALIYADKGIHFTQKNEAYPFIVYQLVHEETPEYMYYIDDENITFFEKLKDFLKNQNLSCSVNFEKNFYYIQYQGKITHVIRLKELQERISVFSLLSGGRSFITLILDDAGENLSLAKECMDLPFPVIFSIWPKSTYAVAIAVLAHEKGLPVYLHQPMEALPRGGMKVDIGKQGLYTDMSFEEIRDILYENIVSLPYVQGLNNNMGSKFTLNETAIIKFYKAVQEIKPYFSVLDSLTVPQSKLYRIGKENEFLVAKRDFFIDNDMNTANILQELNRAYELSKRNKRIVIIGHVRKSTVEALKKWQAYKDQNIVFSLPSTF